MRAIVRTSGLMVLCCLAISVSAQVTFTASTDAREVVQNGIFEVSYTLRNAEGREFEAPPFDGFEVVSGPSMSMSTTIINGQQTQSRTYSYRLLARSTGTFTIQPARILVGARTLTTESLTVEVVEGQKGKEGASGDREVFIRLETDSTAVYPGQQVKIDYNLYTTVNVRNYNTIKEDSYDEFYYRYVRDPSNRAWLEVIDGVQYKVQRLRSLALFPQKAGPHTIDPLIINVGIAARDERRSFFFSTRTRAKILTSNTLNLDVRSLPNPQPKDFTGAVGQYSMRWQANRTELTTNDALVVSVQITGNGDAKRWTPPAMDHLKDAFEVYEPKILQDRSVDSLGQILNTKRIEYVLVPRQPGRQEFTVDFTYFNPDSSKYLTLTSDPLVVDVQQGQGQTGPALITDESERLELRDLQSPGKPPSGPVRFLFRPTFFALTGVPFVLLFIAWRHRKKRDEFASLAPAERKKLRALKTAKKYMESANELIDADERDFYEAISMAIYSYISGKLRIPASELSKKNIGQRMEQAGLSKEHRSQVMDVLREVEMVLYAGGTGITDRRKISEQTLELITEIERQAK